MHVLKDLNVVFVLSFQQVSLLEFSQLVYCTVQGSVVTLPHEFNILLSVLLVIHVEMVQYRDSVINTVEEKSSNFSVIQIHWLPLVRTCRQQNFVPIKSSCSELGIQANILTCIMTVIQLLLLLFLLVYLILKLFHCSGSLKHVVHGVQISNFSSSGKFRLFACHSLLL